MAFDKDKLKEEYMEKIMSEMKEKSNENEPSFYSINPSPGICIKVRDDKNAKVFINICTHEKIPLARDFTEEDLLKVLQSTNDYPNIRIPMSIGEPHEAKDRLGNKCECIDVAINTKFLEKIKNNNAIRDFFFEICFSGIEEKYQKILTRSWRVLEKKCHGSLQTQFMRTKSKPLIIDCDENSSKGNLKEYGSDEITTGDSRNLGKRPVFEILQVPPHGHPTHYIVEVQLPSLKSTKGLYLDVGSSRIRLTSRSRVYYLDFHLPKEVLPDKTLADFNLSTKILSITLTVVKNSDCADIDM